MAAEKTNLRMIKTTGGVISAVPAGNARQQFVPLPGLSVGAGTSAQYAAPVPAVIATNARQKR